MKKFILMLIVICGMALTTNSQNMKFFQSRGYSSLADFGKTPVKLNYVKVNQGYPYVLTDCLYYTRLRYVSLYTLAYNFRYNIFEPDQENAIGINLFPSFGLSLFKERFMGIPGDNELKGALNFTIPIFLSYNIGAGSTYQSVKNSGAFVGFGFEYNKAPLFSGTPDMYKTSWINPVVVFGVRYWNDYSCLKEFNFKIGIGEISSYPRNYLFEYVNPEIDYRMIDSRCVTFRLTWLRYFRY